MAPERRDVSVYYRFELLMHITSPHGAEGKCSTQLGEGICTFYTTECLYAVLNTAHEFIGKGV